MSLDLHDIERSVGADLLRRPIISVSINAALLRVFVENVLASAADDDDDFDVSPHIFSENPLEDGAPRPSVVSRRPSSVDADAAGPLDAYRPASLVQNVLAALLYLVTSLVRLFGLFETLAWLVCAVVFKLLHLPRVYCFEKLLLDVRALCVPHLLPHIDKTVRFHVARDGPPVAPLVADRRGIGPFAITFVAAASDMTRDTFATLRLFRYATQFPAAFWQPDAVALVGRHDGFLQAVVSGPEKPAGSLRFELGWHVDVVEETKYKMAVEFTRSPLSTSDTCGGNMSSPITLVSKRAVRIELPMAVSTEGLELLVKTMDQFAAVCESSERGHRPFNGKRLSIYAIGLFISLALIVFYEGAEGLIKPSADVLTLAVGAFTLWMTLGRSAALGETEEEVALRVQARENILLSYHGLAHIDTGVLHTCWVPETLRAAPSDAPPPEDAGLQDGSLSLVEAAVCLSIFNHFGHLVKWKGAQLKLTRFRVQMTGDLVAPDVGHIVAADRVPSLQALPFAAASRNLQLLGGTRCKPCEEMERKRREERESSVVSTADGDERRWAQSKCGKTADAERTESDKGGEQPIAADRVS